MLAICICAFALSVATGSGALVPLSLALKIACASLRNFLMSPNTAAPLRPLPNSNSASSTSELTAAAPALPPIDGALGMSFNVCVAASETRNTGNARTGAYGALAISNALSMVAKLMRGSGDVSPKSSFTNLTICLTLPSPNALSPSRPAIALIARVVAVGLDIEGGSATPKRCAVCAASICGALA